MVACAAVSVQLNYPNWMQPQPAGGQNVDQLKQQLLLAVENADLMLLGDVISKLECTDLTREILETTRIGAVVNDIRKRLAESAPELSKRCRALIKDWQKLAELRPTSSCGTSSNGGTPNLVSPAVRRGLTPGTPARGARVTSTGLPGPGTLSSSTSPSVGTPNGSYAPPQHGRTLDGPLRSVAGLHANMHKSYSVGADLAKKAVEESSPSVPDETTINGKRKSDHLQSLESGLTNGLGVPSTSKRSKCASAVASPAMYHQSVVAARKANVQSTSELVAQLSENLPQYMAIDLSEHEQKVKREQKLAAEMHNEQHAHGGSHLHQVSSSIQISSAEPPPKKKDRRGRPKKNVTEHAEVKDAPEKPEATPLTGETVPAENAEQPSTSADPSTNPFVPPLRHGKYDWKAMLPTLETLIHRDQHIARPSNDPRRSYLLNIRGREVLALPYVDIGMPDFLEYGYPDADKFLAEENFIYGAPR